MTTPSQLRQTPDVIRHLMQVAHKWAAETNDPDHGRSDTLEIELRKVLQPAPVFKVDQAERDAIKEIIAGLAFICEISDTGKLVDHAFNELERRRSAGATGRPPTKQEDAVLHHAARAAGKVVAQGKLAEGMAPGAPDPLAPFGRNGDGSPITMDGGA